MLLTAWSLDVRTSTIILSVGLLGTDRRTSAFCAAPPGNLLVVHHFLRGIPRSQRVHRGGGAAGCGTPSRRVSGIRAQIAHPHFGNTDYRQSFRWKLRGTGRTLPGTEAICEGAPRV